MTTDYTARRIARESYVTWLENCERKLRDRPTPVIGTRSDGPSARTIRKKILDGI
jgi:hypothetical protein